MNFVVIILGFVTSLVAVFSLCMVVTRKLAQWKANLDTWEKQQRQQHRQQQQLMQKQSDEAWRGNKQMLMD